jgi:hypothetical protein
MTETPCAVDGCGYPAHDHRRKDHGVTDNTLETIVDNIRHLMKPSWSADAQSHYLTADHRREVMDWLQRHHVSAPEDVRLTEVYGLLIIVWQFKRNAEGKLYVEHGRPAERRLFRWMRIKPPKLEIDV